MGQVLGTFVTLLALAFSMLVLVRVALSWTNPEGGGGFTAFIYQATEPVLAPIRQLLPPMGGLDWSPFIVLVLLGMIARIFGSL